MKSGFSLLELIISTALGLFLLTAFATIYISTLKTVQLQQALAGLQDNGRFLTYYFLSQLHGATVKATDHQIEINHILYYVGKTSYLNEQKKPVYALFAKPEDGNRKILADDVMAMNIKYEGRGVKIILLLTTPDGQLQKEWDIYGAL